MTHVGVRFYRVDGVELVLVPLLSEVAAFTRSAGDGYFLVALMGEPGSAYPLDLRHPASFDPDYLAKEVQAGPPRLQLHARRAREPRCAR